MLAATGAGVLVGVGPPVFAGRTSARAVFELDGESPTTCAAPVSPGLALFTTPRRHGIGLILRLAAQSRRRRVERLGVMLVADPWSSARTPYDRVGGGAADEVEGERNVVRGPPPPHPPREVLDRCGRLQHLDVHRLVGECRPGDQRSHQRCRGRRPRAPPTSGVRRASVFRRVASSTGARMPESEVRSSCPSSTSYVERAPGSRHASEMQACRMVQQVAQPQVIDCHALSPRRSGITPQVCVVDACSAPPRNADGSA